MCVCARFSFVYKPSVYMHMHIFMYMHTYVCMRIYIYISIYIYIYIYRESILEMIARVEEGTSWRISPRGSCRYVFKYIYIYTYIYIHI